MAVIYGYRFGVSGETNVGEWRIKSHNVVPIEVATSLTGQAAVTIPGAEDWEGTCTGFGYAPSVNPGDTFTFTGMVDKPDVDGTGVTGSAIVVGVTVNVSYERNDPVQWMMEFAGNGPLNYGTVTVSDTGIPTFTSSCSATVLVNGSIPTDLLRLALTAQNSAVKYNATHATNCGYYRRVPGTNSAAAMLEYYHNGVLPHELGDKLQVQIGLWDVKPLLVISTENYGVRGGDEGPPRVRYTCAFAGYVDATTKGTITTPNGAVW